MNTHQYCRIVCTIKVNSKSKIKKKEEMHQKCILNKELFLFKMNKINLNSYSKEKKYNYSQDFTENWLQDNTIVMVS